MNQARTTNQKQTTTITTETEKKLLKSPKTTERIDNIYTYAYTHK